MNLTCGVCHRGVVVLLVEADVLQCMHGCTENVAWIAHLRVLLFSWLCLEVLGFPHLSMLPWVSAQAGPLHQALILLNSHYRFNGICGGWGPLWE
jgi:hypothetical protein